MTTADGAAPQGRPQNPSNGSRFVGWASNYIDERTSISGAVKELGRKIFPDHWSFMLGEIALWSFVVVLLSGTFLTFFFQAAMTPTHTPATEIMVIRLTAISKALIRKAMDSSCSCCSPVNL